MLENLKMMLPSIRSYWSSQIQLQKIGLEPLKIWKMLLFYLKHSLGSWIIQIFEIFLLLLQSWNALEWLKISFIEGNKNSQVMRHYRKKFWAYLATWLATGN